MGRTKRNWTLNTPKSWDEVTLEQYSKIQQLYAENKEEGVKPTELLAILANTDVKDIETMPALLVSKAFEHLSFIQDKIDDNPSNNIIIDNEEYYINNENELKFKEFVDFQTVMENNQYDYPTMLAILCRKKDEIYDEDFVTYILPNRIELFKKQPISLIFKLISFFLVCSILSEKNMERFIKEATDQANLILNKLESFQKNGGGVKYFTTSQMKTLQNLRKQINSI